MFLVVIVKIKVVRTAAFVVMFVVRMLWYHGCVPWFLIKTDPVEPLSAQQTLRLPAQIHHFLQILLKNKQILNVLNS